MPDLFKGLLGNYRLLHQLGRGGFSDVYLGEHIHLGTKAAIKILTTKLTGEQIERFRNEARMIASLNHPNIIRVLDFGISDSTPFLVMQYAAKGSLRHLYPSQSVLPLEVVLRYVQQIAAALQFAHERHIIHCDIKPENILLGTEQEVLLSDFGIAVIAKETNQQRIEEVAGTVSYMSPEQLQGMPTFASDQYALAVIIYEWLCGTPPFVGEAYLKVAYQHQYNLPPPLHAKVPISPAVEAVIITALEKDPKLRFASISAFVTALNRASHLSSIISDKPFFTQKDSLSSNTMIPFMPGRSSSDETTLVSHQSLQERSRSSRRRVLLNIAGGFITGGSGFIAGKFNPLSRPMPVTTISYQPIPIGKTLVQYNGQSNTSTIYDVAWSPDATKIASVSTDTTVHIWDAVHGHFIRSYTGHDAPVTAIAWSPNGMYIVTGSDDKTAQVWSATTGALIMRYTGHNDHVQSVSWSPDSKYIASGSADTTVRIWDALTGHDILPPYTNHQKGVWRVAWSYDGQFIASASGDTTVQVWSAITGSFISTYVGHKGSVSTIAWSSNGQFIASGSDDTTIQVWVATTGATIYKYIQHNAAIHRISWRYNDSLIASSNRDAFKQNNRAVHIWDMMKNYSRTYKGKSGVAWAPDGSPRLASTTDNGSIIQVWQAI